MNFVKKVVLWYQQSSVVCYNWNCGCDFSN